MALYSYRNTVIARICFYFISCRKAIPKDPQLHLNEKVLSETELNVLLFVAALLVKLTFFSILTIPVTAQECVS